MLPNQIKGVVRVTFRAAKILAVDPTTITAGLSATRSATSTGKRSASPSPNRYSILMFRPSVYPNSRNRFRSAAMLRAAVATESGDMTPTNGVAGCCPRAASGHAAAPPSPAMNSRRLIYPSRKGALDDNAAYSMTRVAAGASGFLTLIQSGDRPER